jgi:uncharacterized protein YndB with AHSA1/START domain
MEKKPLIHNTFVIERHYLVSPERVFNAFADPVKKRRWFVESRDHELHYYQMDFRVGGIEKAGLKLKAEGTPVAGLTCTNETIYQDIVPNERIVFASTMSIADKHISAALGTIEIHPSKNGTDVVFTHQAVFFEGADGPEMREEGWQKLFEKLNAELASELAQKA